MPAALPISPEEASNLFTQFDTADEPLRRIIGGQLLDYRDQLDAQEKEQADAHFEKLYTEPEYFDEVSKSPAVEAASKVSPFPDAVKYRAANQAYLAHALNVPVESLNNTYDAQKQGYAKAYFNKEDEISDEAFFKSVSEQQKKIVETRAAVDEVPGDIIAARFEDLESGKTRSIPEILTAWRSRFPDLKPAEGDEMRMMQAASQISEKVDAVMQRYGPQSKAVSDGLTKLVQGKSDVFELTKLAETLVDIPPEDRQQIYQVAGVFAKRSSKSEDGSTTQILENAQKTLERGISAPLIGLAGVQMDRDAEGDPKKLATLQIVRELSDAANSKVDPVQQVFKGLAGQFEQGAYGAIGSAPYLALSAIPVAGAPLTMAAYAGTEYDRIRMEYPDVSLNAARGMAIVSGAAQAALDKLQVETIAGKLPATSQIVAAISKPTTPLAQRILAGSALNFAEQYGQETLQNVTPLVVDEVAHSLGADMPDRDWSKELEQFKEGQTQTFFALLPLWLLGTGGISIREVAKGAEFTSNVEGLTKTGIKLDAARDIAATEDLDERQKKLEAAWTDRDKQTTASLIASTDAASESAIETQQDQEAPTVETVKDETGANLFVVRDPAGKEIYRTSDEDAAAMAVTNAHATSIDDQQRVTSQLVQHFQSLNEKRGLSGVKFKEGEEPKTIKQIIDETPDVDKPAAIEKLRERMRIEANTNPNIDPEGDLANYVVDGQSDAEFRDGVFHAVNQVTRGADPLTVVQEHVETELKRAIGEGRVTMDWARRQVQDYEQASGEILLTDTDQSVIEGVSTLAQSYVAGKLRDPQLPTGLRAYFRQMVQYFRHVFTRAGKLKNAIATGKVKKEFETFLAQSVGLDDVAQVEQVRDMELGKSFSIKLSEDPSPGGRVVEDLAGELFNPFSKWSDLNQEWNQNEDESLLKPLTDAKYELEDAAQSSLSLVFAPLGYEVEQVSTASAGSFYFEIKPESDIQDWLEENDSDWLSENGLDGKVRFSDHSNISRQHRAPDINLNPGATQEEIASAFKYLLGRLPDLNARKEKAQSAESSTQWGASNEKGGSVIDQGQNGTTGSQVNPESRAPEGGASFSIKPADYSAKLDAALAKLDTDPELRKQRVDIGRRGVKKIRDRVKGDETSREAIIRSMGELEAVIRVLPSEARGKIGGYRKLSTYKTDKGRLSYLLDRVEKVEFAFEDWLKDYYTGKRDKLFDRAKPIKGKPGEKAKGKGADLQSLFTTLKEAVDWSPEKSDGHVAGLQAEIDKGELTAEEEAHKSLEIALVPMFADWVNADAARRAAAVENAQQVFDKGYSKWRTAKLEERERRSSQRTQLKTDTGKAGTFNERAEKAASDNGLAGSWKDNLLGLLNFEQAAHWVFGENSTVARELVDMERNAAYLKSDSTQEKMDGIDDLFSKLAGGRLKGEQLRYDLSQKSIEADAAGQTIPLSQLEGVAATLMWRQADGRRHMLGKVDENGKPSGTWRYDQSFVDSVEKQLSLEALAVRDYLAKEYAGEYATLNPIYRKLNGIDLPKNENYSPISVTPLQTQSGQVIDPVTGSAVSAGSNTPGSLRTRGSSIAEPNFRDALETYIAHTRQMEHWKAYAKFTNEAQAILNNREVGNSVEAKSGQQATTVLRNWVDFFANGGTRDAATSLSLNHWLTRTANRASSVALIGRIGTLAVQSTQLGAALAQMPSGAYAIRLGKLLTGQLGWKSALDSPYIQRRIKEMPPVVQQAVQGLRQTKPNLLRHSVQKLGNLISGTDALFTAGTYAMVHDYQRSEALKNGATPEEAEAIATTEAERITDRIAQPIRPGARSLFENTTTQPLGRAAWAFASEARKNLALTAYALAKRPLEEQIRTIGYVLLLNAAFGAIIRNAWRDAKDSDDDEVFDEKNWNLKKFAVSTLTEPFYGIPVVGDVIQSTAYSAAGVYQPNGDLFSSFSNAAGPVKRLPDLVTGNQDIEQSMRDVDAILSSLGLLNQDIAAAASLSHLATDLFRVGKNATSEEK